MSLSEKKTVRFHILLPELLIMAQQISIQYFCWIQCHRIFWCRYSFTNRFFIYKLSLLSSNWYRNFLWPCIRYIEVTTKVKLVSNVHISQKLQACQRIFPVHTHSSVFIFLLKPFSLINVMFVSNKALRLVFMPLSLC